ncbi:MAG: winged helix-turn-helix transcriptional regulator [Calditrichaceae bacterium]|nr:winged helix-turn-helix transcriptional regulator [Calditrichaceae bacterium]MBN2710695.1 winged helix-turn-helix transcriptional regulator [Calditrichaceae bacterium]
MEHLTHAFYALSDANRIRILKMLEIRPLCVCEITDILTLAPSTVSKHLSILRDAGFILDEKEGKWVTYYLNRNQNNEHIRRLLLLIREWLSQNETIINDQKKASQADRNKLCGI